MHAGRVFVEYLSQKTRSINKPPEMTNSSFIENPFLPNRCDESEWKSGRKKREKENNLLTISRSACRNANCL